MTLRKRFYVLIVALFVVFAGLSTWCYGADCGFGSSCPNTFPPCYKVTFSGLMDCPGEDPIGASWCNRTFVLPDVGECYGWCQYYPSPDNCNLIEETFCQWFGYYADGPEFMVTISHSGNTTRVLMDCDGAFPYFEYVGDFAPSGSSTNWVQEYHCFPNEIYCYGFGADLYGGTATWEPIWDCSKCDNCDTLDITVSGDKTPLYYTNLNCCPPAEKGEGTTVTISCTDANYVIPYYTIEIWNPNPPAKWVEDEDTKLVTVTPEPNECSESDSVKFIIEPGQGYSPTRARVTCRAAFFKETGEQKDSEVVTIYVEPQEGECCVDPSGGSGGGGGGGRPPPPGPLPGPPFGGISVGNTSVSFFAGTDPVDEFSSVIVRDVGGGEVDIDVKLPGRTQFYTLSRPLAFMRGWSASIDDNNDVTVTSPEGLKYMYYENCNHILTEIKNVTDANVVVFDYNSTTGLIDKQTDGSDANLYIEYEYDGDLLKTLTAHDYNDFREYIITYDSNDRAIAFSGCESCGGYGAFQYEYDANDLLKKVKDANDPNVVIYEYAYNSSNWVTDIYLGEANDANHIRKFTYTDSNNGGYIVDINDYIDSASYRVTREYRNSAGIVAKRIKYENLDEDPADPIGESFIEHIFYSYDANNVVTKKVVIPPLGDSDDPNPNSGIRKEYTYDPNNGRMLTERWFDVNDVNFTVISYSYEFTPDGNNVRVKSSTDARDANTVYSYDGDDVVPKFKTMSKVTNGISGTQQLRYGYEYDSRKRTTLEKLLDHQDSDKLLVQTKYVYGDYGNLVKRYDAYGPSDFNEITEYRYNGFNEMARMILSSGVVSGSSYNSNGKLESEFVLANPDDVNESEPNLISQTKYYYDNNGKIKKIARAKHDGEFDFNSPGSWIWTEYEYDSRSNRTKVIEDVNGLGLETTYEYNNEGGVIKVTLPNGKWTETIRDGRGLVAYTVVGYGDTTVAITTFYYDDNGNLEEQIAPNGIRTRYDYDDFDRLIKVTRGL